MSFVISKADRCIIVFLIYHKKVENSLLWWLLLLLNLCPFTLFITDTPTPGVKRKVSMTEADSEEAGGDRSSLTEDRISLGSELKSFGGSQGSLNSTSTTSTVAPDNPEQFESLKQMKGLMEQGIEK